MEDFFEGLPGGALHGEAEDRKAGRVAEARTGGEVMFTKARTVNQCDDAGNGAFLDRLAQSRIESRKAPGIKSTGRVGVPCACHRADGGAN